MEPTPPPPPPEPGPGSTPPGRPLPPTSAAHLGGIYAPAAAPTPGSLYTPLPPGMAPPTPGARPRPPRYTRNERLAQVAIAVGLVVVALVGVAVVRHVQADHRAAARERRALQRHVGAPQGPASPADLAKMRTAMDAALPERLQQWCRTRRPIPTQPKFVPGNPDQAYRLDSQELDPVRLRTAPNRRSRITTLAVCTSQSKPIATGQTCRYTETRYVAVGGGSIYELTLELEVRQIRVYEIRTGRQLAAAELRGDGNCPSQAYGTSGSVLSEVPADSLDAWIDQHLGGFTVH